MEIIIKNEKLQGRVVRILDKQGREISPVCIKCQDVQNVIGMVFIRDLKRAGTKWVDGRVVDLRPGLTQGFQARCEIEYVNGKLRLFGYKWEWSREWLNGTSYWDREN